MQPNPDPRPHLVRRHRRRVRTGLVGAVALGALLLGACSSDGDDDTKPTTTTSAPAPAEDATTTSTTTAGSDDPTGPATGSDDPWTQDATAFRDQVGEEVEVSCEGPGTEDTIWGTETYTLDSSVCTAAVHVGLITFEEGGEVTIEIGPGQDRYEAGTAHDVTSRSYGTFDGSFTFPDAPPGSGEFALAAETWSASPATLGLQVGDEETVDCAPDGTIGSVWGTETYTSDSSICSAAVHAGLISAADGGTVAIEVVEGLDAYEGSEANDVTSQSYGPYALSFRFADDQPDQAGEVDGDPPVGQIDPAGGIEPTQLPED